LFDKKLSAHLAELSKLSFTEAELNIITNEMDEIVALMDTISDFSEEGTLNKGAAVGLNQIREDVKCDSAPRSEILKNAAKSEKNAFAVPKVV
jgi:aspartyl-tRNA(Asn)/glutamyl-tRNA(Gln) amidotransferase subunit C